ncbi:hypothetical protein DRO97_01060 [Archaeoglobales archaeon]|nr:MAG: hypothetical protein DRO97_01060 [Archaeoglobales archaeon]
MEIAIPSSSLINEKDEKIKTYKIGMIARAASIFRVNTILIYRDPILDESNLIKDILEYLETPQYLRKEIIPIKKSLRYVGLLPPLQIPSHKPKTLKINEVREGVVRRCTDGTAWVDIGVKPLASLKGMYKRGARVTVRVCSKNPLVVEEAKPPDYWGYKVKKVELEKILNKENVVITSRRCKTPSIEDVNIVDNPTVVFGNPKDGVFEIAERLGIRIKSKKCWNTIPMQGSKTVRFEEAIFATLAIINVVKYWGGKE